MPTRLALAAAFVLSCLPASAGEPSALEQTIGFLYESYLTGQLCAERIGTFTGEEINLASVAIDKYIASSALDQTTLADLKDRAAVAWQRQAAGLPPGDSDDLRQACKQASSILAILIAEQSMATRLGTAPPK